MINKIWINHQLIIFYLSLISNNKIMIVMNRKIQLSLNYLSKTFINKIFSNDQDRSHYIRYVLFKNTCLMG